MKKTKNTRNRKNAIQAGGLGIRSFALFLKMTFSHVVLYKKSDESESRIACTLSKTSDSHEKPKSEFPTPNTSHKKYNTKKYIYSVKFRKSGK